MSVFIFLPSHYVQGVIDSDQFLLTIHPHLLPSQESKAKMLKRTAAMVADADEG